MSYHMQTLSGFFCGKDKKMACQECTDAQEKDSIAFYRWKNANIAIQGCDEHLREIFDVLNEHQKKGE